MIKFKRAKTSWVIILGNRININIWLGGIAVSFPVKNEWYRYSLFSRKETDDGCLRIQTEAIHWKGKSATNSYRKDSKRYIKFYVSVRYRARQKPWVSKNPRAYTND